MSTDCPDCQRSYDMLGQHWARSKCSYPELTDIQKEIITGVLMGDGSIASGSKNPLLQIAVIKEEYLEYLDDNLGILSTGVTKEDRTTSSGNDIFRLNTRCLPCLREYESWYDKEKSWPSDIELTPTVLKHLYVCDGNLDTTGSAHRIRISMSNEIDNRDKVSEIFERKGFPIQRWDIQERKDRGGMRCSAVFSKETSNKMLDYMGDPLPGFEYKWGEKVSQR